MLTDIPGWCDSGCQKSSACDMKNLLSHCEYDGHTVNKHIQGCLTADCITAREISVYTYAVRSPLIVCQVTLRPHNQFSRY